MPKLIGRVIDRESGQSLEARVQVLSPEGQFLQPPDAILKVGNGLPFFYCAGQFELEVPGGPARVLVERGTEYVPAKLEVNVPAHRPAVVEIALERWSDLGRQGWHPGNTHIHYDQFETRPDERLRLDPKIEDLRVTAVSILKRWDLDYASNKYPPGVLTEFCTAHHHVECGEENRHNSASDSLDDGYGHVMLLRLKQVVEPISRGYLVDEVDPDYPPLCYACDEAHRQGGIAIWCHNGRGLELPVAAALGKLDAFNLFDPFWCDPEYAIWYHLLNCGFKLPASTGSDWFLCSANRVYAYTGGSFDYESWISALQGGRTFITNGPALFLTVDDQMPGSLLPKDPGGEGAVQVTWKSHYPIHHVEVVWNGKVAASQSFPTGSTEGRFETSVRVPSTGWLAARLSSAARDSFHEPIYAHTSPVYVRAGRPPEEQATAAVQFEHGIDRALETITARYRLNNDHQRREIVALFRQGQAIYQNLARPN